MKSESILVGLLGRLSEGNETQWITIPKSKANVKIQWQSGRQCKLTLQSTIGQFRWIYEIGVTPLLIHSAKLKRGIGCRLVGQTMFVL